MKQWHFAIDPATPDVAARAFKKCTGSLNRCRTSQSSCQSGGGVGGLHLASGGRDQLSVKGTTWTAASGTALKNLSSVDPRTRSAHRVGADRPTITCDDRTHYGRLVVSITPVLGPASAPSPFDSGSVPGARTRWRRPAAAPPGEDRRHRPAPARSRGRHRRRLHRSQIDAGPVRARRPPRRVPGAARARRPPDILHGRALRGPRSRLTPARCRSRLRLGAAERAGLRARAAVPHLLLVARLRPVTARRGAGLRTPRHVRPPRCTQPPAASLRQRRARGRRAGAHLRSSRRPRRSSSR